MVFCISLHALARKIERGFPQSFEGYGVWVCGGGSISPSGRDFIIVSTNKSPGMFLTFLRRGGYGKRDPAAGRGASVRVDLRSPPPSSVVGKPGGILAEAVAGRSKAGERTVVARPQRRAKRVGQGKKKLLSLRFKIKATFCSIDPFPSINGFRFPRAPNIIYRFLACEKKSNPSCYVVYLCQKEIPPPPPPI